MKKETKNKIINSTPIYRCKVSTKKGEYVITIRVHVKKGHVYFHKTRDGNLMEISKMNQGFYKASYYDSTKDKACTQKLCVLVYNLDSENFKVEIRKNSKDGEIIKLVDINELLNKYYFGGKNNEC